MREFFKYFFGKGDTIEFENFGFSHFAPIIVAALVIFLIFKFRDKIRAFKHEKTVRLALALVMIITEMSYFWRLVGSPELNPNPVDHLPITVCGWAVIFGSYMLVTKSQSLFDIVYFWVFSGTIFALITPTVISNTGPTRFRYYQFWLEHTTGYIAIFYMIFVHKMRPTLKSAAKAYVALAILAVIAYVANRILGPGANYLFMADGLYRIERLRRMQDFEMIRVNGIRIFDQKIKGSSQMKEGLGTGSFARIKEGISTAVTDFFYDVDRDQTLTLSMLRKLLNEGISPYMLENPDRKISIHCYRKIIQDAGVFSSVQEYLGKSPE